MTDNAGCVFSEMRGNAASYKDKKSVSAFLSFSFFPGSDWITSGEGNPS